MSVTAARPATVTVPIGWTRIEADTTGNPLAPENINRLMRHAVYVRLRSDIEAGLSNLDVMVLVNGDLYVRGFNFKVVGTFLKGEITLTRHTVDTDRMRGTVTLDAHVGPQDVAAIIQTLAD